MKNLIFTSLFYFGCLVTTAQSVSINTTGAVAHSSAMLDITSTKKGMLVPRMNAAQRTGITTPAPALLVYDTDSKSFWFYNGAAWSNLSASAKAGWLLTGNVGINPTTNFIGTTDNKPLRLRLNNKWAGELNESTKNYFIGDSAGVFTTSGLKNTSMGSYSLYRNTIGNANTAIGSEALYSNTTGLYNTALGSQALYSNNADGNTANGYQALYSNNLGIYNVANGVQALYNNTSGSNNTANGFKTLFSNNTGEKNTAIGFNALYNSNTTENTAVGFNALLNVISKSGNTAIGSRAGMSNDPIACTFVGALADASFALASNSVALGVNSTVTANDQVRIRNFAITSIGGYAGWTTLPSDRRFKKNINENVPGLDFINRLRPVTYTVDLIAINNFLHPNEESLDKRGMAEKEKIVYTGFIAQDVENAAKETGFDFSGVDAPKNDKDFYGLRYGDFVVPLVKAVQEQQQIITAQQKQIDDLKDQNKKILAAIDQLIQRKNN